MLRRIGASFSPPVRFGEKYKAEIIGAAHIILCVNCNLTNMSAADGAISSVTVQNYEGTSTRIQARTFILACGGIENSRLLLWSNVASGGTMLKEQAGLVGRYWFEHHHAEIGDAVLETGYVGDATDANDPVRTGAMLFSLTPKMIAAAGILSCSLRLLPGARHGVKALIEDVACVAPTWASWAYDELANGKLCAHKLKATAEQEPRFENRVALGEATDRFGIPKVRLYWAHSELDLATLREAAKALGYYLAVQDVGRVRLAPWLLGEAEYPSDHPFAGYHHMGGTRMADDPASGVVDRDCRVFGLSNLYVIGSSIFPGGGHSTPTISIVQLALRLSDHLVAEEKRGSRTRITVAPPEPVVPQ
jgi:choline dehydrogenase-like flavoprotein